LDCFIVSGCAEKIRVVVAGVFACFSWGFRKSGVQNVVLLWTACGELRGERGEEIASFWGTEDAP
jgi:hypothetical protein